MDAVPPGVVTAHHGAGPELVILVAPVIGALLVLWLLDRRARRRLSHDE